MQKLDKKQMPQFVGLCVLSTGVFGYFGLRMMTPSPAAAATRPALKPAAASEAAAVIPASGGAAVQAAPGTASTPAGAEAAAPPPTPGMRDPFLIGYHDPKAAPAAPPAFTPPPSPGGPVPAAGPQVASAQIHEVAPMEVAPAPVSGLSMPGFAAAPPAPPLPSGVSALPAQKIAPPPPAPPKWTVTGLLQGEDGGGMAVLRDGESRCIVHVGDFVDGLFRVTAVTRSSVVLRHGAAFYTLSLGTKAEEKAPAPVPSTAPAIVPAPVSMPAPPAPALPRQSRSVPAPMRRQWTAAQAGRMPLRLLDGTEMAADTAPMQTASRIR